MQRGERPAPSLAEAVSATGGIGVAIGILLISIDTYADHPLRLPPVAMFAGLTLVGILVAALLPSDLHAAGVAAMAIGIPGALGWFFFPHAHRFADVRAFLWLSIAAWLVCFAIPRLGHRPIFLALAALVLWLWVLGEVVGTDAYSVSPIPSPPAHTLFSLSALHSQVGSSLQDLDSSDPLYPLAQSCDRLHDDTCFQLSTSAPAGSDFSRFGATCGGTTNGALPGCSVVTFPANPTSPFGGTNPLPNLASGTGDKSSEIGIVSTLFGLLYLLTLWVLDRRNLHRMGTAFVVPGVIALITGAQSLGNATHHAWAGGILTAVAGLVIGVVGDRTGRRFTAWFGGFAIALGAMIVALDAARIRTSLSHGEVKLAGPGFIVISFGVGLVASGYVIAQFLRRPDTGDEPPAPTPPPEPLVGAPAAPADVLPPTEPVTSSAPPPVDTPSPPPTAWPPPPDN